MGQKAHLEILEGSGGPPEGLRGDGKHTRGSGRGLDAYQVVRKGLGGPPGGPKGVGTPTRRSERGWDVHPELW